MGMKFIIVCDKPELEKKILKDFKAITPDSFAFMKSKVPYLLRLCQKIQLSDYWCNAGQSHLITYYHSVQNGYSRFWNIDADDTFFSIPPQKIAEILTKAEFEAEAQKIDNLSLDMHTTTNRDRHWSFGVTYTRNTRNYEDVLKDNVIQGWEQKTIYPNLPNLDNFFTFLRDEKKLKNAIFYVENLLFYHWDALYGFFLFLSSYWNGNKLYHPLNQIYKIEESWNIPKSLIKIDVNLELNEGIEYRKVYFHF